MNKRQKNKKLKQESAKFLLKINIAEELKNDSIAHLIKDYFTLGTISNNEMFTYEQGKILVSKKALRHLLTLTGLQLLEHNTDFEFVDEINILQKKEETK